MPCFREPCQKPAIWKPVLNLRSRKDGKITLLRFTEITVCEEHKGEIGDYLSAESFDKLVKIMREAGKLIPIRRLVTLDWKKTTEKTPACEISIP